ncbi:MAG: erythromycin esterase family protein [Gemmatimonadales bacterium]
MPLPRPWRLLFCATLLLPGSAQAQRPLNLDFEQPGIGTPSLPWGWSLGWSAFGGNSKASFVLDSTIRQQGRRSLRITMPDGVANADPQSLVLQVPADFARGHRLALSGWLRAAGTVQALLTLEAWKFQAFAAADTAIELPAADPAWRRHTLAINVPTDPSIHSIVISATLTGPGSGWYDRLELTLDGRAISALPPLVAGPQRAELAWLRSHATPLIRVDPGSAGAGERDLAALDTIIGQARIVALGESTHGTSEFFRLKHRVLEHLVRERGIRLFAIEANTFSAERVNAWVQGGPGTVGEAMRGMFQVWNTTEMGALLEWMRTWNAEHPDSAVRFVGYDMQDHQTPIDTLRAFLARREPALLPRLEALTHEYRAQRYYGTPQVPDTTRARWHAQAESLWTSVSARREVWLQASGAPAESMATEWAVQAANLFRQAARFNVGLNSPERDSLMAANLAWALHTVAPAARAVVWAHDVHVSHGGDARLSFNAGAQMGAYLRRWFGEEYQAYSLLTAVGSYSATRGFSDWERVDATAFPAPEGSLEAALHSLGQPAGTVGWIVNLRAARHDPAAGWLEQPRPIRSIGYAAYDYGFDLTAVLPLEFDGVLFVDRTTPSRWIR